MAHLEAIECGICRDVMLEPTTLICGHSFCRDRCIKKWIQHTSTCPQCRESVSSSRFAINVTLQDVINATTENHSTCDHCRISPPISYCAQCRVHSCHSCCTLVHRPVSFHSHHIVDIAEKASVLEISESNEEEDRSMATAQRRVETLLKENAALQQQIDDHLSNLNKERHQVQHYFSTLSSQITKFQKAIPKPSLFQGSTSSPQKIKVGYWVRERQWARDFRKRMLSTVDQYYGGLELQLDVHCELYDHEEVNEFDVVIYDTNYQGCDGEILNHVVESGTGLLLFNGFPSNIEEFSYSCFSYNRRLDAIGGFSDMQVVRQEDPIFTGVSSFAPSNTRTNIMCYKGTLVANYADGAHLIAKNEIGECKMVEFNCVSTSNQAKRTGLSWHVESDAMKLFVNCILWTLKMI
ncbi:hypothetical protein P9112_010832 [Eukaryota sp. TZLM1-RC]